LAYALYRLAEAHCTRPRPDRSAALAAARECFRLAGELGSATAGDVRALAAGHRLDLGAGSELPPAAPVAPAAPAAPAAVAPAVRLTGREREVLALVA